MRKPAVKIRGLSCHRFRSKSTAPGPESAVQQSGQFPVTAVAAPTNRGLLAEEIAATVGEACALLWESFGRKAPEPSSPRKGSNQPRSQVARVNTGFSYAGTQRGLRWYIRHALWWDFSPGATAPLVLIHCTLQLARQLRSRFKIRPEKSASCPASSDLSYLK
jgi:hypothetical protein